MLTVGTMLILSKVIVAVTEAVVGFDITIFDTTVVVLDGTVYSVVLDVAAAVLARAFVTVAISYYPFLKCAHKKQCKFIGYTAWAIEDDIR